MLYSRSIDYRIDCPWQPPHPQTCIESRTPPSPVRHFWHPYQHIDSLQNQQPQERMLPLQNQPPPHKNGNLETNFFLDNIEALFVTQVGWFCKGNFNGYNTNYCDPSGLTASWKGSCTSMFSISVWHQICCIDNPVLCCALSHPAQLFQP